MMNSGNEMHHDEILNKLKNTYLFNIFTENELSRILEYCDHNTVPELTTLFEEGDIPDYFYIIISGQVTVYQTTRMKEKIILARLEQGDFFGEMSLLDSFPRSATAKTDTETFLLSMSFDVFDDMMNKDNNLGIKWLWTFCRILSSRLRDTNEKYKQLLVEFKSSD